MTFIRAQGHWTWPTHAKISKKMCRQSARLVQSCQQVWNQIHINLTLQRTIEDSLSRAIFEFKTVVSRQENISGTLNRIRLATNPYIWWLDSSIGTYSSSLEPEDASSNPSIQRNFSCPLLCQTNMNLWINIKVRLFIIIIKVFINIPKTKRLSLHCFLRILQLGLTITIIYINYIINNTIKSKVIMIKYIIHIKLKRHRFIKTFLNLSVFTICNSMSCTLCLNGRINLFGSRLCSALVWSFVIFELWLWINVNSYHCEWSWSLKTVNITTCNNLVNIIRLTVRFF